MTKTLSIVGLEGDSIKNIYKKPTTNIIFNGKKQESFWLR